MSKIKQLLVLLFIVFACNLSTAQNNTNSPYTLYGYGDISDNYSGEQRAMGGVAIGSRSRTSINTTNPASYNAVDSMTFMFDMGVSMLGSRFSYNGTSTSKMNANLEYITMQFPLWKNTGFSMGVLPYSFTGYNFSTTEILDTDVYPDTVTATRSFTGQGGVTQAYMGFSIQLLKHLSLGVNTYYMFGNNLNNRYLTFDNTEFSSSYQSDSIKVNSFRFRYGLQYNQLFNKKHDFTLGAFYEMKTALNATYAQSTGSIINSPTPFENVYKEFETPESFGVGLNYNYNKQFSVGLDYSLQNWADVKFMGVTDTLANRSRLALGTEFIPNPRGRKYFDRVTYRFGLNTSDSYYKINGQLPPKNFGITFGLGLPLRNSKSVLNASFEYGKIGSSTLLREDYLKFTLNAVINENWFFKRKL